MKYDGNGDRMLDDSVLRENLLKLVEWLNSDWLKEDNMEFCSKLINCY